MIPTARRISLDQWDGRYAELRAAGMEEPQYGGPLRRHVADGDLQLLRLRMDDSAAALRLWNFLLTEEERLRQARDVTLARYASRVHSAFMLAPRISIGRDDVRGRFSKS